MKLQAVYCVILTLPLFWSPCIRAHSLDFNSWDLRNSSYPLDLRAKFLWDNGCLCECFAKQLCAECKECNLKDYDVSAVGGLCRWQGHLQHTSHQLYYCHTRVSRVPYPKSRGGVRGEPRTPDYEGNLTYIRVMVEVEVLQRPVGMFWTPTRLLRIIIISGTIFEPGQQILQHLWLYTPPTFSSLSTLDDGVGLRSIIPKHCYDPFTSDRLSCERILCVLINKNTCHSGRADQFVLVKRFRTIPIGHDPLASIIAKRVLIKISSPENPKAMKNYDETVFQTK